MASQRASQRLSRRFDGAVHVLLERSIGDALKHMCQALNGNPSDDAACAGLKAFEWLVKFDKYKLLPHLRPADVHDVDCTRTPFDPSFMLGASIVAFPDFWGYSSGTLPER